jgi:hypothetical protein
LVWRHFGRHPVPSRGDRCRRCKEILASQIEATVDHGCEDERIMHSIDRISAGGMTKSPSRRNFNIVTSCRSRLSVTSHALLRSLPKFGTAAK